MSVHDNTVIDTFWLCCDCPRCLKIMFRRSGQSYENATQTIANYPDNRDDQPLSIA